MPKSSLRRKPVANTGLIQALEIGSQRAQKLSESVNKSEVLRAQLPQFLLKRTSVTGETVTASGKK